MRKSDFAKMVGNTKSNISLTGSHQIAISVHGTYLFDYKGFNGIDSSIGDMECR